MALIALPGEALDAAAGECHALSSASFVIAADVSKPPEVGAAIAKIESQGRLSGVFNNAGISIVVPFADTSAAAVSFLLSDDASYITVTQLVVDGGRTGCFP